MPAAVQQRIQILVEYVGKEMSPFRKRVKDFTGVMRMNQEQFKKQGKYMNEWGSKSAKAAGKLRLLAHGMKGFRMEMLGVMFFGMGMMRFFSGMLAPAMQMAGIFDIINTILAVTFLPIVLAMLGPLLAFGDYLMNLSDSTKMMLGWLVLAGAAIGGFLFILGTVTLGVGAIIIALANFGGTIAMVLGPIGAIVLGMMGLTVAVDGTAKAWIWIKETIASVWKEIRESPQMTKFLEDMGIETFSLGTLFDNLKEKVRTMVSTWLKENPKILNDWEYFKTTVEAGIEDIKKAWETISNLELPEWIKTYIMPMVENPIATGVGAVAGGVLGGPGGAVAGGFLMSQASEIGYAFADALEKRGISIGFGVGGPFSILPGFGLKVSIDTDATVRTTGETI